MKWSSNKAVHRARDLFLDVLFPRSCAGCKKDRESFCANCQTASYKNGAQCLICGGRNGTGQFCKGCRPKNTNLKNVLWAGRYDGALREAVRGLKYGRRKELAEPLAGMLFKKFKEINDIFGPPKYALIIPIPLHFKKEYERGFNQARLVAEKFSKLSNIDTQSNVLEKIKETPAQVDLQNRDARIKNLEGAFFVNENFKKHCDNKKIILIDDVATTGATLTHASRALRDAGAKNIVGLVIAHG